MNKRKYAYRCKGWGFIFFLGLFICLNLPTISVSGQQDSTHHKKRHRLNPVHAAANEEHAAQVQDTAQTNSQPDADSVEKEASGLLDKGDGYLAAYNANAAIAFYYRGLKDAKAINSLSLAEHAMKGLADAFYQKKDNGSALYYYKQYATIRDSLYQDKAATDINALTAKLDQEQKHSQDLATAMEEKNSKTMSDLDLVHYIIVSVIIFLAIVLVVSIYRMYKRGKKEQARPAAMKAEDIKKKPGETSKPAAPAAEINKQDIDHYTEIALLGQINPQFIFYSLNKIQGFMLQNDKLAANNYLSKFVSFTGKVMENARHPFITLGKELEVAEIYIDIQRLDHQFDCTWNLNKDEDLAQYQLPPLILQPFIEDALLNGLFPKNGDRMITIAVTKESGRLICMVEDNGIPRMPAKKSGNGNAPDVETSVTRITLKRIEMLNSYHNTGITVQYKELQDKKGKAAGTKVILSLPAKELQKP